MTSNVPVRQRAGQSSKKGANQGSPQGGDTVLFSRDTHLKSATKSEWDFKAALAIITTLAFVTRFWGIGHPNEVVFDEVHFGKVKSSR